MNQPSTIHDISCPKRWQPLDLLRTFLWRLYPMDGFNFIESASSSAPEYLGTTQPYDPDFVAFAGGMSPALVQYDIESAVAFFIESMDGSEGTPRRRARPWSARKRSDH